MTVPTVEQIFRNAAEQIDRCGLHQGAYAADFNDPQSPCCIQEAIFRGVDLLEPHQEPTGGVEMLNATRDDALKIASRHVTGVLGWPGSTSVPAWIIDRDTLAAWNDHPGRTAAEVSSVLRACADQEAGRC